MTDKNSEKQLSLDDLKVQSFVTTLTEAEDLEVRGGTTDTVTYCTSLLVCDTGRWHGCWPPRF